MSIKKVRIIMMIVIVIIAIAATLIYQRHRQSVVTTTNNLPITTKNQPQMGNPNSPIHVVIFEDLKCMMCRVYNVDLYPAIKKQYIDTNKINYTVINLAFIPGSITAASTARCLYQQKPSYFFQFVDYIYHHQGQESEDWTTIPNMLQAASTIKGIDPISLGVCVTTGKYNNLINNNMNLARKIMGETVRTPSVYINGMLVSPLTMERFQQIYAMAQP